MEALQELYASSSSGSSSSSSGSSGSSGGSGGAAAGEGAGVGRGKRRRMRGEEPPSQQQQQQRQRSRKPALGLPGAGATAADEPGIAGRQGSAVCAATRGIGGNAESKDNVDNAEGAAAAAVSGCANRGLPAPPADVLCLFERAGGQEQQAPSRVRNFGHVEGNFAVLVYVPVPKLSALLPLLKAAVNKASVKIPGLRSSIQEALMSGGESNMRQEMTSVAKGHAVGSDTDCHISLSRTVAIRFLQIDSLLSSLRHKLKGQKRFWADLACWQPFLNDEGSCSFLALEVVNNGLLQLTSLVSLVDQAFGLHGLPMFYQGASKASPGPWRTEVTAVQCKIGHRVHPIWNAY